MDDSEVKETLSPEGSAQESFGGIFSDFKLYVLVYTYHINKKVPRRATNNDLGYFAMISGTLTSPESGLLKK